ncbi:hypothetical protein AA0114_g11286 [Alternaria tenuissima]|uniref:Uncharacterized protein n=1 Tax=Alternaria tenuissima TaxID=119927 RepID=A0A4Q4M2Z6_9PLEO|nr:hypothetical protein AA0114_g11286 [Alternaria tenuissima]
MSGHEHSSAGSHYNYDTFEDFCYETLNGTHPMYGYSQNQLNSPIDYEQSPVGVELRTEFPTMANCECYAPTIRFIATPLSFKFFISTFQLSVVK